MVYGDGCKDESGEDRKDDNSSAGCGVGYVDFTIFGETFDFRRAISAVDGDLVSDGAAFAGLSAAESTARVSGQGKGRTEETGVYYGGSRICLWNGICLCWGCAERSLSDISDLSDIRCNTLYIK